MLHNHTRKIAHIWQFPMQSAKTYHWIGGENLQEPPNDLHGKNPWENPLQIFPNISPAEETTEVHEMKQHDGSELKGPLELAPEAGAPWQKLEAGVTVSPKMLEMVIGWCFDVGLMVIYI